MYCIIFYEASSYCFETMLCCVFARYKWGSTNFYGVSSSCGFVRTTIELLVENFAPCLCREDLNFLTPHRAKQGYCTFYIEYHYHQFIDNGTYIRVP